MDYSYEGLASTISELKKKDVAYAGAGKNLYEASRPAILDTTAGQIAVIDICSTFENVPLRRNMRRILQRLQR